MSSTILHRNLGAIPVTALAGDGIYLIAEDGRRYLDASGGAAVSCLGHSHQGARQAITDQLAQLAYTHSAFFTSIPAEALAQFLVARAPAGFGAGRVVFSTSGSEAIEGALKLARQYHLERGEPRRTRFIGREMSFHGNTLAALAVGGNLPRRKAYEAILPAASHVPTCHPYRFKAQGESEVEYGQRVAATLEEEILRLGPETVAAFIAEPVIGSTLGCVPPVPGYFRAIREICDRHGVLFIADEVMCGMGRTGHLFAIEAEGICPDIIVVSKGLGGGYQPIAGMLASERVVAALVEGSGRLENGHTYMGHALACAASLAVLQAIESEDLLANVRRRGEALKQALADRFAQHPHIGDIRGRGLFLALEFVADRQDKTPLPRSQMVAERLKQATFAEQLLCYPGSGTADGISGDHVLLAPPYIIDDDDIAAIVDRLDAAIRTVLPS